MQIYWISDGQRRGPASVPDIEAMLQLGELTPETLGWHAGCEKWLPLRELPALKEFLTDGAPPPQDPPPIAVELGEKLPPHLPPLIFDVILPGPLVRFLARMVDMSLYAILLLGILYILKAPYMEYFQPAGPAFWLPMVVIEAFFLSQYGMTPGKWLLGIRMQYTKGKPTFTASLLRSALALILGLGCCIYPPLTVLMLIISYFSVRKRGITVWDVNSGIVPMVATPPTAARRMAACLLIFFCIQLSSTFMRPWVPDMMEILRERDPDAARTIEEFLIPRQ